MQDYNFSCRFSFVFFNLSISLAMHLGASWSVCISCSASLVLLPSLCVEVKLVFRKLYTRVTAGNMLHCIPEQPLEDFLHHKLLYLWRSENRKPKFSAFALSAGIKRYEECVLLHAWIFLRRISYQHSFLALYMHRPPRISFVSYHLNSFYEGSNTTRSISLFFHPLIKRFQRHPPFHHCKHTFES